MTRSEQADIAKWLVEKVGVPGAVLAVVFWGLFITAGTLHDSVLVPVITSHTKFIDVTQETLRGLGETQQQQAETLKEISHSQREIVETIRKISPSIQAAPPKGKQ